MKSKFLRILALILVMSSLLSMFAIFASAEENEDTEGETGSTEDSFELLYHRTYDEGWNVENGLEKNDQGNTGSTTFEIDHEQTVDFDYNYFWRLELNSSDNDFLQWNLNCKDKTGLVVEFDVKSDDICNLSNVINFGTTGSNSDSRTDYNFMKVVENKVFLMHSGDYTGFDAPVTEPAFELTNEWTRIQIIFDFSYQKNAISDDLSASDKAAAEEENAKYFLMYIYIGPADGSEKAELWGGKPLELKAENGKGIQLFRFQSTSGDTAANYGTSICFDNMKAYQGVNKIVEITEDMGYGSLVSINYPVTENIIGSGSGAAKVDLNTVLSLKVGVDYCYLNGQRLPIATAEDGTVYGAPVKSGNEVLIPLDKVLEYIGFESKQNGETITVTTGMSTSYIIIGKNIATVGGQEVTLNATPCYVEDADGNRYAAVAISDVEKLFPGYYGDYDEMGYMTVSQTKDLLNRDLNLADMIAVMKKFVFDYFSAEQIYADVQANTNGFQHPYILANGEQLDFMRDDYARLVEMKNLGTLVEGSEDYWMWVHYQRIVDAGETYYKYYAKKDDNGTYDTYAGLEPDPYDENGKNLRGTHSLDQNYLDADGYDIGGRSDITNRTNRLEGMAFAYAITRDTKYLELSYEVALKLSEWTHWGPGHFLNCADSSNDFAVYFDWTYNGYVELAEQGITREDGSAYDVAVLAEILARQGVHEGYYSTINKTSEHLSPVVGTGGGHYTERVNNWAAVCTGGMAVAALAILGDVSEEYVNEATYILSSNFKSLVDLGLDCYAPDGSYNEGPGYWNYGTNTFFRMCAALDSAAGTNYGLMDCWGMDTTCYYACHTEDNDAHFFPFHDGTMGSQDTSYFFYVAKHFNDATLYDVRLNQINGNVKWATPIDLIYYPRDIEIDADEIQLDYYSDNIDLFATRSGWERGALFASIIGGNNNVTHGQIDAGDFVYHNGGNVWIYDMGTEEYNAPGFWPEATRYRYYRMKPEGNNTVAITSDPNGIPYGQNLNGIADAYAWGSNEHGAFVAYDMGNTLGSDVTWERGLLLTNDRKTTVIQDQITCEFMETVYWFAHYSIRYVDKVEISKDGHTAYMKQYVGKDEYGIEQYQTLRLTLVSNNQNLKFEIMSCYDFVHTVENGFSSTTATYSPEDIAKEIAKTGGVNERSRSEFRKLAICSGETITFNVAVVIELIDDDTVGKNTELDVGYSYTQMNMWEPYADERGIEIDDSNTILRRGVPNVNKHIVQSMYLIDAIAKEGTLYTTKVKDYYRAITDAYYAVRTLGVDMPAGYDDQIASLNRYKKEFSAYRDAVIKLQKSQSKLVDDLMGF